MRLPIYVEHRIFIPRAPGLYDLLEMLKKQFTYTNPEYTKKKRLGFYVGHLHPTVCTWQYSEHPELGESISFPRGGIAKIRYTLSRNKVSPLFVDRRLSLEPITGYKNNIVLREDQTRLVEAMLKMQNCLIRSPTASGKTESSLKLIEYILADAGPVLVIVWETDLMQEWIERAAKRFGLRTKHIGRIGGTGVKRVMPITVGMQQTLANCADKYKDCFGGIIADEVQRFAAKTYQNVIDVFPAKYRIGISADERRHDQKEYLIYDAFGEVAESIARASLIAEGKIHDVCIRIVPTTYNFIREFGSGNLRQELEWINIPTELKNYNDLLNDMCADEARNDYIWKFMKPVFDAGNTILVITHRVDNARYWDARIRAGGYKCGLMLGGVENKEEFTDTKTNLRQGTFQAGIGTIQKIGQALDIPRWNRGFILTPVAGNKQQLEQVIGRLRRTCENKTEAVAYYFWDELIYPGHKKQIRKLYNNTHIFDGKEFVRVTV